MASKDQSQKKVSHLDIVCYLPNLVGYLRFVTNFIASYYAFEPNAYMTFLKWYTLSMGLDSIDGKLARRFNQSSRFGASLDMVSDRTSCATIYCLLMQTYPEREYSWLFLICFILDFGSHFLQFCTSALVKSESHKNESSNFIVQFYYTNILFFYATVTFAEFASGALILQRRSEAWR